MWNSPSNCDIFPIKVKINLHRKKNAVILAGGKLNMAGAICHENQKPEPY